jgi:hypothetical protein
MKKAMLAMVAVVGLVSACAAQVDSSEAEVTAHEAQAVTSFSCEGYACTPAGTWGATDYYACPTAMPATDAKQCNLKPVAAGNCRPALTSGEECYSRLTSYGCGGGWECVD